MWPDKERAVVNVGLYRDAYRSTIGTHSHIHAFRDWSADSQITPG